MADSGYGLWPLVVLNTVLVAVFAASFFHPSTGRDWRVMGGFTAFLPPSGTPPGHRRAARQAVP
jgi:hypothetical protein